MPCPWEADGSGQLLSSFLRFFFLVNKSGMVIYVFSYNEKCFVYVNELKDVIHINVGSILFMAFIGRSLVIISRVDGASFCT